MQLIDEIEAAFVEELGEHDLAAPTLDPKRRLFERVKILLEDATECASCGCRFVGLCDPCRNECLEDDEEQDDEVKRLRNGWVSFLAEVARSVCAGEIDEAGIERLKIATRESRATLDAKGRG